MDKDTRNRIERATQSARRLLEQDFADQLEGVFDIRLDGTLATEPGSHLDASQRVLRRKLVAAVEHNQASGQTASEAVSAYLREAAFTTLNRFVALKMLEARDLVQECISRSEQSAGFKEFCGLAPGLVQLPDHGYRLYIESLFDELSTEVKVLFDRRDPYSVLWPNRATFDQFFDTLNATDLAIVWGEDETIGWVYQFFIDRAAVKESKKESQAPRNSRELAERNQFFTPRYVVQFITDNTLGRIWYEMRGTKTLLADQCEYMVRKPGESFAQRAKKDPRDLRVLDPACGSGHFLLYAFGLLLVIYEEAWADPESPRSEATGRTLAEDYPSLDALRKAIPGLILAHNLHGVDIDPRCAQIAQLALWMRAQKAYRDFGIGRAERPQIRRSNIVVAEPLVADEQIAKEFVAKLGDAELGRVFMRLVESLKLAGDMGLLLRIEQLVRHRAEHGQTGDLFAPPEERIRAAVTQFFHEDFGRSTTRRLFAADAAHGLELAELVARQYDVIVMNPPFGETSKHAERSLNAAYEEAKGNLYIAFLYRSVELLAQDGRAGAIVDATLIHQTRYEELRSDLLDANKLSIQILVANGWGVLDAYVETACLVLSKRSSGVLTAMDIRDAGDDRAQLLHALLQKTAARHVDERVRITARAVFQKLPKKVFTFWLPAEFLNLYNRQPSLAPNVVDARCGMSSSDNPRFYKLRWEVPASNIGEGKKWRFLANGGAPSPVFRPQAYIVNWGNNGREVKAQVAALYGSASRTIINESYYFRGGFTYGKRTESFTAQFLPSAQVFSNEGQAIFPNDRSDEYGLLAYLNASCVAYLLNTIAGQHKEAGYVGSIPAPPDSFIFSPDVSRRIQRARTILIKTASGIPESQEFTWPFAVVEDREKSAQTIIAWLLASSDEIERLFLENDAALEAAIGFSEGSPKPWTRRRWRLAQLAYGCEEDDLPSVIAADVISYFLGTAFGRWQLSFKTSVEPADPLEPLRCTVPGQSSKAPLVRERVLVDDESHDDDIIKALESVHQQMHKLGVCSDELAKACEQLDPRNPDAREVVRTLLFSQHLARYTRSRRKAPIYWQLATPSASYSVWLYIHAFSKDTLFRVQTHYVEPKLGHEERRLGTLTAEQRDGATAERKALAEQQTLVEELRAFLAEVKRVASLWNPNLDDGVIINFAPLWRLVPQHKAWQKELKSTWDTLCDGKYDWAHLAMHLWPERVVPKCAKDRSLAIAHDLENVFWEEDDNGKWQPLKVPQAEIDQLIAERTSAAVKDALQNLLDAPPPASGRSGGRRTSGSGSARRTQGTTGRQRSSASAPPDPAVMDALKQAIEATSAGASKADVLAVTGLSDAQWTGAIAALLAEGSVTKSGAGRGTRYHRLNPER